MLSGQHHWMRVAHPFWTCPPSLQIFPIARQWALEAKPETWNLELGIFGGGDDMDLWVRFWVEVAPHTIGPKPFFT